MGRGVVASFLKPARHNVLSSYPDFEHMDSKSKRRGNLLFSSLSAIIEGLDVVEEDSSITPAKAIFNTTRVILTMIRVSVLPCKGPLQTDGMRTGLDDE